MTLLDEVRTQRTTGIEQPQEPRVRSAIGVLVAHFPRIEETHLLREINELERQGQPVILIPLVRDEAPVIHDEAKPWLDRALYVPLFNSAVAAASLRALVAQPRVYFTLLLQIVAGTWLHPRTLIRWLALFPKSVALAEILQARGVTHVHAQWATHATTMAWIIHGLTKIDYSFTVHGPDIFVERAMLRRKIQQAKFIRSISVFNKAFLAGVEPGVAQHKVEVVSLGLNPDIYADAALRGAEDGSGRIHLLSVARLLPNKGYPILIEGCARLIAEGVDLDCTIVGDGPLREETQEWIDRHGMRDRIRLAGAQPQHEVARLMGACDIFVLPSVIASNGQMDGIPLSLIEAMAAGRPVIASAISGIPEVVDDGVSGILVDATHTERIAASIRLLAADPEMRAWMGAAGQRKVRQEFNVRDTARHLLELFDRVTPAPAPQPALTSIAWHRLGVVGIGVRRLHTRNDSTVAEVMMSDGVSAHDVVVKQHRSRAGESRPPAERARYEHGVLKALRQMFGPGDDTRTPLTFSVPGALLLDEECAALVLERAQGEPLDQVIRAARRRWSPHRLYRPMRNAGRWLRRMQEGTRTAEDGRHLLTALVVLALRDLDCVATHDRIVRRHRTAILQRLRQLEQQVAASALTVTGHHGDYWPGNIFIAPDRVEVIDFEGYREGLPLEDVAYFLLYIRTLPLFGRYRTSLEQSFLEGYAGEGTIASAELALFRMMAALRWLARRAGDHQPFLRRLSQRAVRNLVLSGASGTPLEAAAER